MENRSTLLAVVGIMIVLGAGAALLVTGGSSQNPPKTQNDPTPTQATSQTSQGSNSLQLRTFKIVTGTPSSGPLTPTSTPTVPQASPTIIANTCPHDLAKTPGCKCAPNDVDGYICSGEACQGATSHAVGGRCRVTDPPPGASCFASCLGKPVIYLYPPTDMNVTVTLNIPGYIVESIPSYPNGGWNVLAHPDGTLDFNGKTYNELYYESQVSQVSAPDSGIVIPKNELAGSLSSIVTQLGLLPKERDEFLDYWLPKLEKLNKPYIEFSVLSSQEKNIVDNVQISPKPDTNIAFIAYFKGLNEPSPIKPLDLPKQIPQRKGFTAVEWGGTIGE